LKWTAQDVIVLVLLVGAFGLRAMGINSFTESVIIAVAVGNAGLQIRQRRRKL